MRPCHLIIFSVYQSFLQYYLSRNIFHNYSILRFMAEKAMAPHSSTLAWKIPWMEEPARLKSMGSLRVGHDWVTSLSLFVSYIGEGNGNPLQYSCPENPRDGGAWWAAVYGVTQSRTRLKWLSSSSSSSRFIGKKYIWTFSGGSDHKESACNAEDLGLIPGSGRSREGNGNLLHYFCLENSMDRETWWATVYGVAKSQTWLND